MNKLIKIVNIIVFVALIIVSVSFVSTKLEKAEYQSINITIEDSLQNCFVDKADIINFIRSKQGDFLGYKLKELNLLEIENDLNTRKTIANSEVYNSLQWHYTGLSATLNVIIDQRDPIVRIFQKGTDYYVDEEGVILPWTNKYTPRVVTAHGNITQKLAQNELYELSNFINSDPFWRSQIDQIYVDKKLEFTLVPRVGNHKIFIGGTDQLPDKFRNLKAFYKQVIPRVGWDKYKNVNVKFSNQIVCSK